MASNAPINFLEQTAEFRNLELMARQLVDGFITGLHKSPYHGFSVEFAEHKAYNPGQSLRHIDWKLYGRTDRLYTRTYEEETNLRCMLLVDASPSMYYPRPGYDKLRFAVIAAACIATIVQRQRDAVGLGIFADTMLEQTRIRSTGAHVFGMFGILQRWVQAEPPTVQPTYVAAILHQVAEQMGQRALVVLFSDMLQPGQEDEVFAALQHLRHNKHEVLLFHTTHASTEMHLSLPDKPLLLIDAETGERMKMQPAELQEAYSKQMATWQHDIVLKCAQNRIDLVDVDVEKGISAVLQAYLAKRARMS